MCILHGHETHSLRRHYPVTGSAVGAASFSALSARCSELPRLQRCLTR
ncbi:hypothetical protein SCATT_31760 [Streptantibioticus cattleyicolor NRRL 8057 = DSM 46488]|uniref:Uncharacterized protein n=1 Tax=Streptantibioticus cattleyicolor (strain ATCC 35852 / DSM 46488 / JCM 4925 / NBRC 14057 / NRRL 8057) TaxID=1003195 RepID=G8WZU4_STREN|nr:hypothetical protein SCATT_31760 [Streptantibioticus cattleyicolor NRRL 8057 = DSM 46488]